LWLTCPIRTTPASPSHREVPHRPIAGVRLDGDGAHAAGRNLLHQFIRLVRRGGVSQGDAGAIFRQAPHNAGTDAARANDDQRDFVFQGLRCFLSWECSFLE
jgi:hypothetical protein